MVKVAIYVQIRTDRGEQNIRQQAAYVREFYKRKGQDIYKVNKDEKTGKTEQRIDYQRMLRHWEEGKFDTVVIQDVDRLTRNYYDGVELEKFVTEKNNQSVGTSRFHHSLWAFYVSSKTSHELILYGLKGDGSDL